MIDEIMLETEEKMQRAVNGLHNAFGTVRTGRANAMVLDRIKVDYYGVPTPINDRIVEIVKKEQAGELPLEEKNIRFFDDLL